MLSKEKEIRFTNEGTVELIVKEYNEVIVYQYAGFWERFLARFLDTLIIIIPQLCIPLVPAWLYWSLQQSSEKERTVGQGVAQIKLMSIDGNKVTFGQATGRFFGNFLNVITFFVGYLLFFTGEKKQCLHDMLSGTIVVKEIGRKKINE
ncbi:RDD family protein [Tenacibaculum larymnensis]|uniref:RDD family protein n=1 Tax=Tenacibaculum larymnensis TaxID=2878201 RepID=A0A9X4ER38_9FLAO|nr:RDD family protein [Tenacibaculum larymnensis]MDE1205306.1 RDD family protein [Tenacibaculum larymnensis]